MLNRFDNELSLHYIDLVNESSIFNFDSIKIDLIAYLKSNEVSYKWDNLSRIVELHEVSEEILIEICNNFDIVLSINSITTAKVTQGLFGQVERDYPFEVIINDDLPIIGIIDTGVSNLTPLKELLINTDNDYDRFKNNPLLDSVGHGTAVGAFASLGKVIAENPNGKVNADAKLLSIKVLDSDSGDLPISVIENYIRKASFEHGVKIFVLTINFKTPKKTNEDYSTYAYVLDKLSYELDILVFISIGNYDIAYQQSELDNYPSNFINETYNLLAPSESINNITIGSIGDNFRDSLESVTDKNHPTLFTRTFHFDFENSSKHKVFKPDLVYAGGNYEHSPYGICSGINASLQVLSQPYEENGNTEFFDKLMGTSLSAPLVANLVAKLMKLYPGLNSQSYKSLLINSTSSYKNYSFTGYSESQVKYIVGNGIPNEEALLYSNDDTITMVLEDSINPGEIKSGVVKYYQINIPEYLNTHEKKIALLEINVTLCYKILPLKDNQIGYNPIHMAFNLFKNLDEQTLKDALSGTTKFDEVVLLKSSKNWSQDAYYKGRILNNCQKVRYTVPKEVILENDNIFVIGVNSIFHKLVRKQLINDDNYNKNHDFSLAISIRENTSESKLKGRLYNDLSAINTLENTNTLDLDLDV